MNRLDDVLRAGGPEPRAAQQPRPAAVAGRAAASSPGDLELRGVTFGYSRLDPPLIEDFNLTLQARRSASRWSAARAAASRRSPSWWPGSTSPGRARSCSTASRATGAAPQVHDQLARDRRPGHLPVRGHRARQPDAVGPHRAGSRPGPGRARRVHPRRHRRARRAATTASSRKAGATSAAASASGWRSPARWSATRAILVLDEATSALDPHDREADRRQPAPPRLHLPDRRPPPEHDPRLRRDHRAGPRQGRPARHARAALGRSGTLQRGSIALGVMAMAFAASRRRSRSVAPGPHRRRRAAVPARRRAAPWLVEAAGRSTCSPCA